MNLLRIFISMILWVFPWSLRRPIMNKVFGYKISKNARIGFSIILPNRLEMADRARIGHLSVCKELSLLQLGEASSIGNLNWITGFPKDNKSFFMHRKDRDPCLIIGSHSAITNRHYIDCTDKITIGSFTTLAGFYSQLLTHSIDITNSRQDCMPIHIGSFCFIGTACVFLPGAALGSYCVLGAKSLLNKSFTESYLLYGGVPALPIKELSKQAGYFNREIGFVH